MNGEDTSRTAVGYPPPPPPPERPTGCRHQRKCRRPRLTDKWRPGKARVHTAANSLYPRDPADAWSKASRVPAPAGRRLRPLPARLVSSGVSAVSSPVAAGVAGREVQRPVQAQASRQYQRRSWQALPPSATIWSAGKRMPHIQQDLAVRPVRPSSGPNALIGHLRAARLGSSRRAPRSWRGQRGRSPARRTFRMAGALARLPGQPAVHQAARRSRMCLGHMPSRSSCARPPRPLTGTWSAPVHVPCRGVCLSPYRGRAGLFGDLSRLTVLEPKLQPDKRAVTVQSLYRLLWRVVWTTSAAPILCTWLKCPSPRWQRGRERASAAIAIPSISPRVHRLAGFLHKSSTASCTER